MLTEKALNDGKWGKFPALRRVLEGKQLPDSYFGWCSVSDNVFEHFLRTLEIAILLKENEADILHETRIGSPKQVRDDLRALSEEMRNIISFVEDKAKDVENLLHAFTRQGTRT